MEGTKSNFKTSFKTRMLYSLTSLGISIHGEAINSGIVTFFVVDTLRLSAAWWGILGVFIAIYHAILTPLLGYASDRTKSRWGRRIPYVKFGIYPYVITFILIFAIPFKGRDHPIALLISSGSLMIIWNTIYTALATGYYGLMPEMFTDYIERTDVAAKMNIFQIVGLFVGVAVPPILAEKIGWLPMALTLGSVGIISMFIGKRALFETHDSKEMVYIPFFNAFKVTFFNRSFLTAAVAQAMRFFSTGMLTTGMFFYLKYSLKVDTGNASTILGIAFVTAAAMLYPWRQFVANKTDSRVTLILADIVMIAGVTVLGLGTSLTVAYIAAVILGIGLSGLVLNGDVITSEVIDEDEVNTGLQRAGMYFGMMTFLITLSGALNWAIFGYMMPAFGYDTKLDVQPASVDAGFRMFMTIPTIIGFVLSIIALYFYPLHGKRLNEIKAALKAKEEASASGTGIKQ